MLDYGWYLYLHFLVSCLLMLIIVTGASTVIMDEAAFQKNTYLYGGHFTLHTDCKPAELTLNNAKSRPPARIERWNLRLQEYHFSTVHTKGQDSPSDFLFRHPSPDISSVEQESAEQYVRFIVTHSTPKGMSLVEIQQATRAETRPNVSVATRTMAHSSHQFLWTLSNLRISFREVDIVHSTAAKGSISKLECVLQRMVYLQ